MKKYKILKLVTVPDQLEVALKGQMADLKSKGFNVAMASSYDSSILAIIEREKVPHYTIPFVRDINIAKDIWTLFLTVKLILKIKPDIVHTQSPKAGFIGMLACRITRVPIRIHTVAGLPLMETFGFKKLILVLVEKLTYKLSTLVIVNSKNLLQYIIENIYPHPEKIKVLGNGSSNGVDLAYFTNSDDVLNEAERIEKEYNISTEDFIWCFVGRIVKDKGIEELVNSFERLSKNSRNSKLILLGSFEKKNCVSAQVKQKILNNENLLYFGHQKDIRPYLSLSDAFVFPSYREGLPDSLIQACCFNLPAVATNINGCNEIIINNVNGLLVEPKNCNDLYEKMEKLQNNKELQKRFSEKTRDIVASKFSQREVWNLQFIEYQKQIKINC